MFHFEQYNALKSGGKRAPFPCQSHKVLFHTEAVAASNLINDKLRVLDHLPDKCIQSQRYIAVVQHHARGAALKSHLTNTT